MCAFKPGWLIQRRSYDEPIFIGLNPNFTSSDQKDWDGKPYSLKHGSVFPGRLPLVQRLVSRWYQASHHYRQAAVTPFGWTGAVSGRAVQYAACCFIHCLHLLGFVDWIIHTVAIVKWSRPEKFIFLQDWTWCGSVLLCTTPELAAAAF